VLDFIARLPLRYDERHLVLCPLYHAMAPAFVTMVMLMGGCVVILRHFDPEPVLRTIEHERITSMVVVPTMLSRLLALPPETLRK
jgi:fatty-acyl-CoA synthase